MQTYHSRIKKRYWIVTKKKRFYNFCENLHKIKKNKFFNLNKKSYNEYFDIFLTYLCMYRLPILNKLMPVDLSVVQTFLIKS